MLAIRLLGAPALEQDGRPGRGPRGRKAWALLAYLVLAERPPSRRHLAELLFGDADDPLGALRWTLSELRRVLDVGPVFAGDPVQLTLGPEVTVDVLQLAEGGPALLGLDGDLLEGFDLPSCHEFGSWLLVAQHRISSQVEARLREEAAALLAAGRPDDALAYAGRAVARNPLEEGNHALLIRSLALAGNREAALRQAAVGADVLRRELGVRPSKHLHEAAAAGRTEGAPRRLGHRVLGGRAAAHSQLEAGRAALAAGAVDTGLECLRRAVADAEHCGDVTLHGRALLALGGALVHAVRGGDEEGTVALHQAAGFAGRSGDRATAATAFRELAFVEVQAGRRDTAAAWLAKATDLAEAAEERAAVLGLKGMNASDQGDYPSAFRHLAESVEWAERAGDQRQQAWSLSILARAHLLRAEYSQASAALAQCLELVREQRWMAFLPWPQSLRAEVDLAAGDLGAASEGLEAAWVQACQIGDPCWEGVSARGLGQLHLAQGDAVAATAWLAEAAVRVNRVPDRYQWMRAYVLDAAAAVALDLDDTEHARGVVATLGGVAARCDMRELVVRAELHKSRLGDEAALRSARLLGSDIDNPALSRLLQGSPATSRG